MITRLHIPNTKTEVSLTTVKVLHGPCERARPVDLDHGAFLINTLEAQDTSIVCNHYKQITMDKRPYVAGDERFHLIDLSFGMWIIQVTSLHM